MKELIEYLRSEWLTLSGAPFIFILACVLVFGLAYAASQWRFGGIIELLRERLAAKDQQLDDYRERLHLVPAQGSAFSRQSHTELQTEALRFVGDLREWLANRQSQDTQLHNQQRVGMRQASEESQRQQLWDTYTAQLMASSTALNNEYDGKFKVKAIVLRDELLSRVRHPDPQSHASMMYEHPTNPIGMGMVAEDLERLARLLR